MVARWDGGEDLHVLAALEKERFGAESLERPALVRLDGGWRIYMSCATPGTRHWRIEALEAADPADLAQAPSRIVFPGSATLGVKDPVIRRAGGRWHAWICCHPLEEPGEEDRMTTAYATSGDGLAWEWHGTVLSGRAGAWDERGARVTALLPGERFTYDGRATREENFSERTGIAAPLGDGGTLQALAGEPVADARYLDIAAGFVFYEHPHRDGSHDLRVQRLA